MTKTIIAIIKPPLSEAVFMVIFLLFASGFLWPLSRTL